MHANIQLRQRALQLIDQLRQSLVDPGLGARHRRRPTDFTRERVLTFPVLMLLLLQKSLKSLRVHLHESLAQLAAGAPAPCLSGGALTHARAKLHAIQLGLEARLVAATVAETQLAHDHLAHVAPRGTCCSTTADIYATSIDYEPTQEVSLQFFKTVQNKVHRAITGQTAAETVHGREDAKKPNLGLTNWRGAVIHKQDVSFAKNYRSEPELEALNSLVEQYLIFAQGQAMRRVPMHMADWIEKLNGFLTLNDRDVLNRSTVA